MKHLARVASGKLKLGLGRSSSRKRAGTVDATDVTLERAPDDDLREQLEAAEHKLREANEKNVALRTRFDEVKEQRGKLQAETAALREQLRLVQQPAATQGAAANSGAPAAASPGSTATLHTTQDASSSGASSWPRPWLSWRPA